MMIDYYKLVDAYLDYHRSMYHTEKTILNYKEVLYGFVEFCIKNGYDVLSSTVFSDYRLYLHKKALKSASVGSYLRHIKAFVHWLGDFGYIEDKELYKVIRLPKQEKKNVLIYSDAEIALIFDSVLSSPDWINLRDKLIICLMYDCGLRQSEVCKIKRSDLDLNLNLLHVHGKGNKDRIVPVGNLTKNILIDYLRLCPFDNEMFLLNRSGDPLTSNAVKLFIAKINKKLPFPFSSHKLRHNFATNFLIDQYNLYGHFDAYTLMILLGHEQLSTTDRYVHLAKQFIASNHNISHLDKIRESSNLE